MITLPWCADIHLNLARPEAEARFLDALRKHRGEPVVICGDITTSRHLVPALERIADAVARPIAFVLGNHDHYGGSVAGVRDTVRALNARRPEITWLPPAGAVRIDEDIVLIGVDGWADGRYGDGLGTPLRLNDDRLIAEIAAQPDHAHRLAARRVLADADAARLDALLEEAIGLARHVVIATHVPPVIEVLPQRGRRSSPDWWPILACGATGTRLRDRARRHAGHRFTVLAGHTHVAADVIVAANLRVLTNSARYGAPVSHSVTLS
ncbi:MAG: metallophosphoesterase [Gemmatimonadales bacterium]